MSEAARIRPVAARPLKTNNLMKRVISYALLALVSFLLGFLPMWVGSLETSGRQVETTRQLRLARLESGLASAVIDVQRGDYAPALKSTSSFFTTLRAETDRGAASSLSAAQIAGVQPLFDERDEIITLLARSDPAAGAKLSNLYAAYRLIING